MIVDEQREIDCDADTPIALLVCWQVAIITIGGMARENLEADSPQHNA